MKELLQVLARLQGDYNLVNLGLGAARLLAFVSFAPFLGGRWVPAPVRVVTALALALACYPVLAAQPSPAHSGALVALLLLKETLAGMALGFAASLVFRAAEAAGDLIEAARGASTSEVLNPATREPSSPLGTMYGLLCVCILFSTGGHLVMVEALSASFSTLGVASLPSVPLNLVFSRLLSMTAGLLVLAAALAGPVLVATVLADLLVGLVSRAAPQINSYFMALPLKATAGLLVAAIGLSAAINVLAGDVTSGFLEKALELLNP